MVRLWINFKFLYVFVNIFSLSESDDDKYSFALLMFRMGDPCGRSLHVTNDKCRGDPRGRPRDGRVSPKSPLWVIHDKGDHKGRPYITVTMFH